MLWILCYIKGWVRVWVLGSAEIINMNPATKSKRQFVIPVPAIAWLDLMQLTSWCDLFQDLSWGTGCSIKHFRSFAFIYYVPPTQISHKLREFQIVNMIKNVIIPVKAQKLIWLCFFHIWIRFLFLPLLGNIFKNIL